jgi:hypothetical protein
MYKKISVFLLLLASMFLAGSLAACGSAGGWLVTITPTPSSTLTPKPPTITPTCPWPCANDSLTLTADASLAVHPQTGDLGWGAVYGVITDAVTGRPINNAQITCAHISAQASPNGRCGVTTWSNADGIYSFSPVNLFATDRITLIVDAPGYKHLEFQQGAFTQSQVKVDLKLEPTETPTP